MRNDAYRVRVDFENYKQTFIPFEMQRSLSYIEILSLKINQEGFYQLHNAGYGALVGRVVSNGGFGVPNAKISIFIPIKEEDKDNNLLTSIYNYETPYDLNEDGYRYNLLANEKENIKNCYEPTGSFPIKRTLLDNDVYLEILEKYYKFTTSTNDAGDYMIMGIPTGPQQIHLDVDISDIGFISQKPFDLIANGANANSFDSYVKFKKSKDLDSLAQVQTFNSAIDIKPFWGQGEYVGINRHDIKLPLNLTPTAYIVFGNFTDSIKGAIGRNSRPRKKTGRNCELLTGGGSIEIIRRIAEGSAQVETLNIAIEEIDDNGNAIIPVPLNLTKKITDEFGNLIASPRNDVGIPTSAKIRMKVSLNESIGAPKKRTANYLIPNLYNDFRFNSTTLDRDFYEVRWKKTYTVANYIARAQRTKNQNNDNFLGLKRIGECEENLSIPFNRIKSEFNILYSLFCIIINALVVVVDVVDNIIEFLTFGGDGIKYPCDDIIYNDATDWRDNCVMPKIAEFFNVVGYEFYNDFLIGSLYHFKFKFKIKYKASKNALYYKYSAYNCRDYVDSTNPNYINRCKQLYVVDREDFDSSPSYFDSQESTRSFERGLIVEYNGELFYAARNDVEINQPDTVALDLSTSTTEKSKLLYATNFQLMGGTELCDIDGDLYFIDLLTPTTYQDEETNDYLINIGGFDACVKPNNINEDSIYKISQFGVDLLGGEEDGFGSSEFYLDSDELNARKYLCENFNPYNEAFNHVVGTTTPVTDEDGQSFDITEDVCDDANNSKPIRNVSPYFHYWGLKKGKTSIEKAKESIFKECD